MKKILQKVKKIKFKDIIGVFIFLLTVMPACLYKFFLYLKKEELWLICETEKTARDNGYYFYKYMKKNHQEIKSFYAINKSCSDYLKVKSLGNIIQWGSFKHYFFYMSATKNISSHKEGNPNQLVFTICHLYLNLFNNRVFLQHGVLYQNHEMFHKPNTKFKVFIAGAKPEYDFLVDKYEYDDEIKYTGLARFDSIYNKKNKADSKIILFMPTWRRWLTNEEALVKSEYFKKIMSFINSKELNELLSKNDKYLYFCPHASLRNVCDLFNTQNDRVKIIDIAKADIQKLLLKGSLLITDYSSLHTDFAYMKKPIIYYQYDEKEFKERHIGKVAFDTYYDYKKDGFGVVVDNESDLINSIQKCITNHFEEKEIFQQRIENFFELYDNNNCERIFNTIR